MLGCFRIHLNYVFCCFQILCLVVQYKNYITHPLSYIVNRKTVQFYIGLCFELLIFFLVIWLAFTRILIFYDNQKVSACKNFLKIPVYPFPKISFSFAFWSISTYHSIPFQDFYLYNNNILNLQLYYTLYSNTTFETVVDSEYQFLKDCLSILSKSCIPLK